MVLKILMSQWDALRERKCVNQLELSLYRDAGLAVIKGLSGPEIERLRKDVVKIFKYCGSNITIEANLHTVSYILM